MKQIPLSRGLFAFVDDEDFDFLMQWKWWVMGTGRYIYATGFIDGKRVLMHRFILGISDINICCDHINGERLDNRKCNIRSCSHSENMKNKRKTSLKTSSIYKGVRFHKRDRVWLARIRHNYKEVHLGSFKEERQAAIAYNYAAKMLHGDFACINEIK